MKIEVLGILELNSIADGIGSLDAMVKAAPVRIIRAGAVNPGKYLILVTGDIASVEYSMDRGVEYGKQSLIDHLILNNVEEQVVSSLNSRSPAEDVEALGILETLSIASSIEAADRAVKTAEVRVLEIQSGNALGRKAALTMCGSAGDVEDAMGAAVPLVKGKNQHYRDVILSGVHSDIKGYVYGN